MKGEEGVTGRSGGKGKATVIRIHCMRKESIFNKMKKIKKLLSKEGS